MKHLIKMLLITMFAIVPYGVMDAAAVGSDSEIAVRVRPGAEVKASPIRASVRRDARDDRRDDDSDSEEYSEESSEEE